MTRNEFPIMLPRFLHRRGQQPMPIVTAIPWSLIALHEAQAQRNHGGQSLQCLAERGGLSPSEACAVLEDRPWRQMYDSEAMECLDRHVWTYLSKDVK